MTPVSRETYDAAVAVVLSVFVVMAIILAFPWWGLLLGLTAIGVPAIWNAPPG